MGLADSCMRLPKEERKFTWSTAGVSSIKIFKNVEPEPSKTFLEPGIGTGT
jgi:hypothetical protein